VIPGAAPALVAEPASTVSSPSVGSPSPLPGQSAALLGQFMASSFVSDGEGHGAMPMADPQAGQPPMLAMPQHA
jgi:hypothetical protein